MKNVYFLCFLMLASFSCKKNEPVDVLQNTYIKSVIIDGKTIENNGKVYNVQTFNIEILVVFSAEIDLAKLDKQKISINNTVENEITFSRGDNSNTLRINVNKQLDFFSNYLLHFNSGENLGVKLIDDFEYKFVTQLNETPKFPTLSNDDLLTLVQEQTFKYFWDYAHPSSRLARERLGSGETVTTGGSGFGLMAILVGIERGFITRQEGFERFEKIVNFLQNNADKFHGAFPHWLNGTTGKTQPFSMKDNGADLVETSFLIAGLLAVQSYFSTGNTAELAMCTKIQQIWEDVEWTWFQKNGEQKLYWHWSPNYGWDMNMPISGWNESLITYVLAASSPTFPIVKSVYTEGWARNGAMKNGNKFYDIVLPLGERLGGPLFFTHYSFLGLDPRNLSDEYANYWQQNVAHANINYSYCVANPKGYFGYSDRSWGLSASDIPNGYTASSPTNDRGTIAVTAALSSFPYTPEKSLQALNFYYYILGDKLWGEYGFKDSFDLSKQWFANSYLAIDQGPIVVMIENYRTGFMWDLFMQRQDVKNGLGKLGFK